MVSKAESEAQGLLGLPGRLFIGVNYKAGLHSMDFALDGVLLVIHV